MNENPIKRDDNTFSPSTRHSQTATVIRACVSTSVSYKLSFDSSSVFVMRKKKWFLSCGNLSWLTSFLWPEFLKTENFVVLCDFLLVGQWRKGCNCLVDTRSVAAQKEAKHDNFRSLGTRSTPYLFVSACSNLNLPQCVICLSLLIRLFISFHFRFIYFQKFLLSQR